MRTGEIDVDENGWAHGPVSALAIAESFTLLSPEGSSGVDAARWAHQAESFFRARLAVAQDKRYPAGTFPLADMVEIDIGPRDGATTRVHLLTLPEDRAPQAIKAGIAGAAAIGGAGFDALVKRTKRIWQARAAVAPGGDSRAPLLAAAVLASLFLAPIVPPGGGTIFGVKGARQRLESRGLRT